MTNQHSFDSVSHYDCDPHTRSQAGARALNAAIIQAEISESFEKYIEIFDAFYADDIEVRGETGEEPIRGKARVRSLLLDFLVPLHVAAEVGGASISIRVIPIPGDAANETHSTWSLDLVGASGELCTLSWRTLRKWNESRVVYERHYDHQQIGGLLTCDDSKFNPAKPAAGLRGPS